MTKTFGSVAANVSWGRWWPLVLGGWVVAAGLSGCAGGAGAPSAAPMSSEPVTESDEPEARKRARIRLELASNYFENGQTTVALDEIKQSLVADPSYPSAYVLRGLVYMRMNETGLAEDSFRRALQLNPRDADALHNYGWFACQQGRHVEAIDFFQRALASPVYGGQAKTLMAKGICQTRMGQFAEAEGSFSRSYELDAANPITGYNLTSLLYRRGEYTRAQFYIRRLNNSELANAETLWLGIKVERRLNNTEATEQLAQQLSRRYPKSREWASYQRGAFDE
ncbi:type IV pilus biogenesis/stability protein PilW [Hydrogenophaga sp.]|uniref:type IV pilus biogenesis/stability protein PilW n=1 Tax=Hydrogenophaga sp. TaxID=1904254 RepID=UPI00286D6EEA|nr:type IV pilus biogenesis/stability protein PilW [Hydrogenophaga sp.]